MSGHKLQHVNFPEGMFQPFLTQELFHDDAPPSDLLDRGH
jgi:hypothetical protein